ncbi:TRAP transporter small permease [Paracoccus pacificus]|uniref:TRAP transporter small permease protein n=1 Tax=Paracoccus pacificus TaxID=1463598 RepID=A0ABW4R436_9RHOB
MSDSSNGLARPPGNPGVAALDAAMKRVTSFLAVIGMSGLVLAIIVVVWDIVWRRIGGRSMIGTVDLTELSVVAAASLSIPYAFAHGRHVTVDLLTNALPGGATRLLDIAAAFGAAVLTAFLLWLSYGRAMEVWSYGDVSQDLAIPMIWYWALLLFGLAASVVVCLVNLLVLATANWRRHDE